MARRAQGYGGGGRQRGFTVLEVVVSFVIVALTLAAAMQAFSGGFRNASTSAAYLTALSRAQSDLARHGAELTLRPGMRQGRYADGMAWRHRVTALRAPDGDGAGAPTAYRVDVTVFPDGDGRNARRVTLTGLRLASGRGAP